MTKFFAYLAVPENFWRDPAIRVGDGRHDGAVDDAEQEREQGVAVVPQDEDRDHGRLKNKFDDERLSSKLT